MRVQTKHAHIATMMRVVNHVVRPPNGPVRVLELAEIAGFSRFHMSRFFRSMLGETVSDLVRRLRLERAAYTLAASDRPVACVALDAGFSGPEAFSRAFRAAYGVPPSTFRCLSPRPSWRIPCPSNVHWTPNGPELEVETAPDELPIKIVTLPTLKLAVLRHVGDYSKIPKAWTRMKEMRDWSQWIRPETRFVTLFHDSYAVATDYSVLRADLGFTVPSLSEVPPGMRALKVPSGTYVCSRDLIPSDQHHQCWMQLDASWVPHHGRKPVNTPALDLFATWPTPWESARMRVAVGLESDIGEAGDHPHATPG